MLALVCLDEVILSFPVTIYMSSMTVSPKWTTSSSFTNGKSDKREERLRRKATAHALFHYSAKVWEKGRLDITVLASFSHFCLWSSISNMFLMLPEQCNRKVADPILLHLSQCHQYVSGHWDSRRIMWLVDCQLLVAIGKCLNVWPFARRYNWGRKGCNWHFALVRITLVWFRNSI